MMLEVLTVRTKHVKGALSPSTKAVVILEEESCIAQF